MKTVLFGGGGLVGSTLTSYLSKIVTDFTVVSRSNSIKDISHIKYDALNPFSEIIDKLPKIANVIIINAASIMQAQNIEEEKINNKINYEYVLEILKYAKKAQVQKIIYTSSLAFLKKPFLDFIDETHPIEATSNYAHTKLSAEIAIKDFSEQNNINWFSFRITSPVSIAFADMNKNIVKYWLEMAKAKKNICIYGNGTRKQNFVATYQIAEIYGLAIQNNMPSGIYQIASETAISMKDLATLFADKFDIQLIYDTTKPEDISYENVSNNKIKEVFEYNSFLTSKQVIQNLLENLS